MKKMTAESFAAAQTYIMTSGRTLDRARFQVHFAGGDPAEVVDALAAFQNDDGGFGHGLEPDLRTPASSAIATSMALAIMREVDAPTRDPLVNAAVRYLLRTYDGAEHVWPIVPPAVEDAPHAPWWTYAESKTAFNGFRINPKASLLGHLYHFATKLDAVTSLLEVAGQSLLEDVAAIPDDELGMHDFLALLDLISTANVPDALQRPLTGKLRRATNILVATDPARWAEYTLQPLQVAPAPDSLLASAIDQAAIEANLDYRIDEQTADGSWDLPWSWDFVDARAWAQAEKDWKGFHAVNNLRIFAAYDRLADM